MTERMWIFGTRKLRAADGTDLVEMVRAHSKMEAVKLLLIRHPIYESYNQAHGTIRLPMMARDWDFIDVTDISDPQLDETRDYLNGTKQ